MVDKKREMESKERWFCRYDFGKIFQIGHEKAFKIYGTMYTPVRNLQILVGDVAREKEVF